MIQTLLGIAGNIGLGALNNEWAKQRTTEDRAENYRYGEMAAQNADMRTRALYNDFYSPESLMRQYKAAGISPGMMFGGTPGQGGMSGASATGAASVQTPFMPISLIEGVQAANLIAQTEKTKAETEKTKAETQNVKTDTERKEIQKGIEQLAAGQYKTEWTLLNSTWTENGKEKSIFEAARDHFTYDSFLEWLRNDETTSQNIKLATTTEAGQKILRSIFISANQFHRDIMTLGNESVNAGFQTKIIESLEKHDYANMNAAAAVQELRTSIATNELTESQKEAWNNLLDRLGKKGSTGRDIAVILGMILSNFSSKVGIKINTGGK